MPEGLEQLAKELEAKIQRRERRAAPLREKLEGIEQEIRALNASLESLRSAYSQESPSSASASRAESAMSTSGAVREICLSLPMSDVFTPPEVFDLVRKRYPGLQPVKATVSAAVKRLADSGEIFLIAEGAGSRPAKYSREKPDWYMARIATLEIDDEEEGEAIEDP